MYGKSSYIWMLFFSILLLGFHGEVALASCDPDSQENPIAAENCLLGNPSSEWDINGAGDLSIQGFATNISVNRGETVFFKIDTNATDYYLDIYRMGYYDGLGARKVATVQPSATLPQNNCLSNSSTGLIDCGNWNVSASWAVPADATSGIYFAKAVREDTSGASHIVFIVRDDASTSDILFQTADTTWQAYNTYGGNSLYTGSPAGRAYKVSYNRPFNTRSVDNGQDWLFHAEYPMVRWLEANGYDVSYFTGVDSDRRGNLIQNHNVFLSVGHDEYWSGGQRANVEAARDAGVHLAFFSGNEVFWKTRWENSIDGSGNPYRTLVCYKETHANAVIDPEDPPIWTGTWRDPRFSPPADGGRPENALTGTIFTVNAGATTSIEVPAADGRMRFWRNTSIANLAPGNTATLPFGTLGYEWDEDLDNGFRPAGLIRMSTTTVENAPILLDYGSSYGSGTATHHLTLYRHSSGALVFGAGTVQWSWGLDSNHDNGSEPPDASMQQATVNLLADMNVQPATLRVDLVPTSVSTDTATPTTIIAAPTDGSTVQPGSAVVISGTASDVGGGIVGGVEVSVDGGATWHPANGRTNWSYTWIPSVSGDVTIKSRAIDDSVNLETPGASITVTVGSDPGPDPSPSCPSASSIWPAGATPAVLADPDTSAVELGVKFRSDVDGFICGIRFYKSSQNTGTHVGSLWSIGGQLLAQATFVNETASGWQQVNFANPVPITANAVYVASYHTNVGRYSIDGGYFTTPYDNAPLHALLDGESGGNGVYSYGSGGFPTNTWQSSNYWVDVVFATSTSDTTPPTVAAASPADGATEVGIGTTVTATFSEAMDQATIDTSTFELRDGTNVVAAGVTYDEAAKKATLTPSSALANATTYTATVKGGASGVKDLAGNALAADVSWSFTTVNVDTAAPTVVSTSPAAGAADVNSGTMVTATFSEALDAGTVSTSTVELRDPGGVLVSATVVYDAATRTATLTPDSALAESTSYTATVKGGASGVKDLSGNPLAADVSWSFTTGTATYSLWDSTATPTVLTDNDKKAIELGVKFRSNEDGYVTSIRFYKGPQNTGTHVGNLWSSSGQLLAQATFTDETASGWQKVDLDTPVAITANTEYVVSYHTTVGQYSVDENYFANSGVTTLPLYALQDGEDGGNGVYVYSATPAFPTNTFKSSNYWVDVVFTTSVGPDTTPPTVVSTTPTDGAADISSTTTMTATFSEAMDTATINNSTFELRDPGSVLVPATVAYDAATRTATLTPDSALANPASYTGTVKSGASGVKDLAGNALAADVSWSFTTGESLACPCSLWDNTATPTVLTDNDKKAIELGVKFQSDVDGLITGIRFYKSSQNTGTHVGNLWTTTGTLLATATFTNETGSGWQQVNFDTPVATQANTVYVASYHTNVGRYSVDENYFATSGFDASPLHALQNGVSGGNGVYRYSANPAFPSNAFKSSNYWVDVIFTNN